MGGVECEEEEHSGDGSEGSGWPAACDEGVRGGQVRRCSALGSQPQQAGQAEAEAGKSVNEAFESEVLDKLIVVVLEVGWSLQTCFYLTNTHLQIIPIPDRTLYKPQQTRERKHNRGIRRGRRRSPRVKARVLAKANKARIIANIMYNYGIIKRAAVKTKAEEKWENVPSVQGLTFTNHWIHSFLLRAEFRRRRITCEDKPMLPLEEIWSIMGEGQTVYTREGSMPYQVLNMDETAFNFALDPTHMYVPQSQERAHDSGGLTRRRVLLRW